MKVYSGEVFIEAFIRCMGLLNLLDYKVKFMVHDLLPPQMKYQTVIQRKEKKIAYNQQRKIWNGLLCEMHLMMLFIVINIK